MARERDGEPDEPLFPTREAGHSAARRRCLLAKHTATAATAARHYAKRVTPHTLRHTNAMLLRAKNVDISTIALWLGHESTKTTQIYLHADQAQTTGDRPDRPARHPPGRYRPPDTLLAFLETL